jgi:hypothetical protein
MLAVGMLAVGLVSLSLAALWPGRGAQTLQVSGTPFPTPPPTGSPAPNPPAVNPSTATPPTADPATPGPVSGRLWLRVEGDATGSMARVFVDDAPVLEGAVDLRTAEANPIPVKPGSHLVRIQVNRVDRIDTQELRGTFESGGERVLSVKLNPEGGLEIDWK